MSPNDRKALKMCAKKMGADKDGYNPIEKPDQADELLEKFGFRIQLDTASGRSGRLGAIDVHDENGFVKGFVGFDRNKAIVYAACHVIDPEWEKK